MILEIGQSPDKKGFEWKLVHVIADEGYAILRQNSYSSSRDACEKHGREFAPKLLAKMQREDGKIVGFREPLA